MDSTSLLQTPKTGRSRFSKALPTPPPALDSFATSGTVPFPQLQSQPLFPPRKQSVTMATKVAPPPSLGAPSIYSPLPALPQLPFAMANDSSLTLSPGMGGIKRKPVRKPVPAAQPAPTAQPVPEPIAEPEAVLTPTPRQMKRVSSISSLLSAYSNSSTDSAKRSSHTSDGSKGSEPSPSSEDNDGDAAVQQPDTAKRDIAPSSNAISSKQFYGQESAWEQSSSANGRPKTPPTQPFPALTGTHVASASPASASQETNQRREIWRRRASSNRSDRSIAVSDLKLKVSHGHTDTASALNQAAQTKQVHSEKALPPLSQARGPEPGGSISNTLPFRDLAASLGAHPTYNHSGTRDRSDSSLKNTHEQRPPPPPPKQSNQQAYEADSRPSDVGSNQDSILGDILSNYSFPTPPPAENTSNTRKTESEVVVKEPVTAKLGRKPVGSPPAVQLKEASVPTKNHPLALTPGASKQEAPLPAPPVLQTEAKELPKVPGVGLRPGTKNLPSVPLDKSPRVPPPIGPNETVVSPVAEEMDKIKSKFKAFVHKHSPTSGPTPEFLKTASSSTTLAADARSVRTVTTPVMKDLPAMPPASAPVVPAQTPPVVQQAEKTVEKPMPPQILQPLPPPVQKQQPETRQPLNMGQSGSLPQIQTSPTGELTTSVMDESHMGGLNLLIPQSQSKTDLPSTGSTASLTTMQTTDSQSKPSSFTTSAPDSIHQDRRSPEQRGPPSGGRPRAGTTTSMASNAGPPRGRALRPVASNQSLQGMRGTPPQGYRAHSRPRGDTSSTLPPFAPSPMFNPFRQRPQTASGPAPKGPKPLDSHQLYGLADSLSKNLLVRRMHEEKVDTFPMREADTQMTEKEQSQLQSIRRLFPIRAETPTGLNAEVGTAAPITTRHFDCWFRHENWVSSHNQHNSVECQTCHKKEKDPRMVCGGCDLRICYDCYEKLMVNKRDLRAMLKN